MYQVSFFALVLVVGRRMSCIVLGVCSASEGRLELLLVVGMAAGIARRARGFSQEPSHLDACHLSACSALHALCAQLQSTDA